MFRCVLLLISLLVPTTAVAQVSWTGDFETGDLSQYDYLLNPTISGTDYTTIVGDIVAQGQSAARIELHDDARWSNNLRRVELQHQPVAGRTAEGAQTYFAWSFYLPEELSSDPSQQIGYWESGNSYQQMMAFTLRGSDLSFVTRQPNNVVHWDGTGVATPGEWHRIAMRVLWSKDVGTGTVSVWFDGVEVVSDVSAKTLNDDNAHFVQFGLLRGNIDFADVPVIYLDDAVEGDTLADVHPDLAATPPIEPAPADMGPADTGSSSPDSGVASDMAATGDSGVPKADTGSPTNDDTGAPSDAATSAPTNTTESGCCAQVGRPPNGGLAPLLLLAFVGLARSRR